MRALLLLSLVGCGAEAGLGKVTLHRWEHTCPVGDKSEVEAPVPPMATSITAWITRNGEFIALTMPVTADDGRIIAKCDLAGITTTMVWVEGPIIEEE